MKLKATIITDPQGVKTAFVNKHSGVVAQANKGENIKAKLHLAWQHYLNMLSTAKFEFEEK